MKCAICGHHVLSGPVAHDNCLHINRQKILAEAERRIQAIPQTGISATDLAFRQGVAIALNQIKDMQAGR